MTAECPHHQSRSWLDSRVHVSKSEIEGNGLFATSTISASEVVMVLGGVTIDSTQLVLLQPHNSLAIAEGLNLMQTEDDPAHSSHLQHRYREHFSPFINGRIRRMEATST